MHPQNFFATFHVGQIDRDLAIETTRTQQRGIEHIRSIRSCDDDDAFLRIEAVHLDEECVERLFALVMAATNAAAAMPAHRGEFIVDNNAGRGGYSVGEHVAHTLSADYDEHLD